jgi:hypothetical protein
VREVLTLADDHDARIISGRYGRIADDAADDAGRSYAGYDERDAEEDVIDPAEPVLHPSERSEDGRYRVGYGGSMVERPEPPSPPSLDARLLAAVAGARGDLERVRAALTGAERGAAGSQEALKVVSEHWRLHKDVYRAVGGLIAEEFREAVLVELEGWKGELREQLGASPGELEQARGRERDASVEQLRARMANTESGLDRAEVLVELGELHADRHEDSEAERHLRDAEQELAPYRQRATGSGIADVLVGALPSMVRGETTDVRAELASLMRASQLLERVYEGLARVVEDAEEAQRYLDLQRGLRESLAHGSQGDLDFESKLREELSQQGGNTNLPPRKVTGPPAERPDEPHHG